MTDVVREVKDAARIREDALLNRVKAMVEERQWTMNESNLRMMRDIEELKVKSFFWATNQVLLPIIRSFRYQSLHY